MTVSFAGDKRMVESLVESQMNDWELAGTNYASLKDVLVKTVSFEDFRILVQFNPKRIISSSAKTDARSVSERPCFLCESNRPREQKGIVYRQNFVLLVNPYPIFARHLTIPSVQHFPQRIRGQFDVMLQLASDLPDYAVIYNGPACGASAPDHFHFQAVQKGSLPVENDFETGKHRIRMGEVQGVTLSTCERYLRSMITLQGREIASLGTIFELLYTQLESLLPSAEEPMMNILTLFDHGGWTVHIFPRKQHRPRQYSQSGDEQLLLSPASIDMGGVLIMPRKSDFIRIDRPLIEDVFRQVCVNDQFIRDLANSIIRES